MPYTFPRFKRYSDVYNTKKQTQSPLPALLNTTQFIEELQPEPGEIIVEKTRYSAFFRTDLKKLLGERGVKTLIVTGVGTNACVETTCREGFMHDYYIIVPDDLVATTDSELHDGSLRDLDRYFAVVASSADLLRVWEENAQNGC